MIGKLLGRECGSFTGRVTFDSPPPRFSLPLSLLVERNPRLSKSVLLGFSHHGELLVLRSKRGFLLLELLLVSPATAVCSVRTRLSLGMFAEVADVSVRVQETAELLVACCVLSSGTLCDLTVWRRGCRESLTVTLSVTQKPVIDIWRDSVDVCCGADVFVLSVVAGDEEGAMQGGESPAVAAGASCVRRAVAGEGSGGPGAALRVAHCVSMEDIVGRVRGRMTARRECENALVEDFEASLWPSRILSGQLEVCCAIRLRLPQSGARVLVWVRAQCRPERTVEVLEIKTVHVKTAAAVELSALCASLLRKATGPHEAQLWSSRVTGWFVAHQTRSVAVLSHPVFPLSIHA